MTAFLEPDHATSDLDLIDRARSSDPDAVEELYRRHRDAATRYARSLTDPVTAEDVVAEAFARVLESLVAGGGPTLAFRPYLLRAVRNVYVSHVRGDSRLVWVEDDVEDGDAPARDEVVERHESTVLASAFVTLPERWQAVLWHTAVEDDDHATVGRMLGIKANAVAALGFRARDGLRKAYLSAHLAAARDEACRPFREQLAPYVRGRLRGNRRTQVEAHLADCADCTAGYLELGALNSQLGAVLAPALLGASATGYAAATVTAGGGGLGVLGAVARGVRRLRNPAVAAGTVAATAVTAVAAAATLVMVSDGAGPAPKPLVPSGSVAAEAEPGDPVEPAVPPAAPSARPTTAQTRPVSATPTALATPSGSPDPSPTPTPRPTSSPTSSPSSSPTSTPTTSPTSTPTPAATPTSTTSPTASPTTPSPTVGPSPSGPAHETAEDLALGRGAHQYYGPHHHVEMAVASLVPSVLTLEVRGYLSHTVHTDRDFGGTTCTAGTAVAGLTTLTCGLAAGLGTFAIDLVVDQPLDVLARIGAPGNGDPDPGNDTLAFSD